MKANELMIGDWVKFDEDICSVDEIRLDGTVVLTSMNTDLTSVDGSQVEDEEIESIPLTPEILEKNGFHKCTSGEFTNNNVDFILIKRVNGFKIENTSMLINYTHELQHALRLCGIDKEIKL